MEHRVGEDAWQGVRVQSAVPKGTCMSQLGQVKVEISVILGRSRLPIHQFLRMGRGAVIPLDAAEHDEVWILANNHPIARGEIVIQGDRVAVQITDAANVPDYFAD